MRFPFVRSFVQRWATPYTLLIALLLALALYFGQERVIALAQDISFYAAPTAEKAMRAGEWSMSSREGAYDLPRAARYFEKAAALDPSYPYVYHQLARVEFLEGDLALALLYINRQIRQHGDSAPNSFYMRGLIRGYIGQYGRAALDYAHYLEFDPGNWAAINDYAWVLLKAGKHEQARVAIEKGLADFPDNVWLLNSYATALFEEGRKEDARAVLEKATAHLDSLTHEAWLVAYPGNDPKLAEQGIDALRASIADNMHRIESESATSTLR